MFSIIDIMLLLIMVLVSIYVNLHIVESIFEPID